MVTPMCDNPPCEADPNRPKYCYDSRGNMCDEATHDSSTGVQCGCDCKDKDGNFCVPPELIPKRKRICVAAADAERTDACSTQARPPSTIW